MCNKTSVDRCMHVYGCVLCVQMCTDADEDMCGDMRRRKHVSMCSSMTMAWRIDMRVNVHIDLCMNMRIGLRVDMCGDMRTDK